MATIAIGISPKSGGGYTTTVPVSALAEDGVPPEEGDSVQFSCEGKVQSVSGSTATVSIDSINGEPVGAQSDEGSAEEEASETPEQEQQEGPSGASPGPALGGGGPLKPKSPAGTALLGAKLRKAAKGNAVPLMRMGGY